MVIIKAKGEREIKKYIQGWQQLYCNFFVAEFRTCASSYSRLWFKMRQGYVNEPVQGLFYFIVRWFSAVNNLLPMATGKIMGL